MLIFDTPIILSVTIEKIFIPKYRVIIAMSQANPQVDVSYLNDFITTHRKKHSHDSEFQRRKLLKIANELKKVDSIEGQLAEASIEFHFCNYERGISILKNVLKLTQNKLAIAWDLLLDAYIQLGDLDNIFSTYKEYLRVFDDVSDKTRKIYLHIVRVYLMVEFLQEFKLEHSYDTKILDNLIDNTRKLENIGISIETYRKFVSLIFKTFYENFKGTIEQSLLFQENDVVIRVCSSVANASDLFELNSKYNDQILSWYGSSTDELKVQIEKIIVYFMHKNFDSKEENDLRVLA